MTVTLREVIAVLDSAYPPRLAEPWDTGIGLTCGDLDVPVSRILFAVDADPATAAEAIGGGCQLLVTHHPLLFRPVQTVAACTDKGAMLHRLIRSGVAHFAAHTNADRAIGGVNDALAEALGLVEVVPLVPADGGEPGEGLGRLGRLPASLSLRDFVAAVAAALPPVVCGVRAAGDPDRLVRTVAVCGGAGGSELDAATRSGADVYVTSDITHHTAQEHCADPTRPAIVEVAHWAGEWPWLARAAGVISCAFGDAVVATVSTLRTDAWSLRAGGADIRE